MLIVPFSSLSSELNYINSLFKKLNIFLYFLPNPFEIKARILEKEQANFFGGETRNENFRKIYWCFSKRKLSYFVCVWEGVKR